MTTSTLLTTMTNDTLYTEPWAITERSEHYLYLAQTGDTAMLKAHMKWDGCTEVYVGNSATDPDPAWVHVCDLDAFIAALQRLSETVKTEWTERVPYA